jgi:hypothetical protein
VTVLVRRVAPLLLAVIVVACGSTTTPSSPSRAPGASRPALTPVPGAPSPTPPATLPPTSVPESDPALGPIWNALPPSWPTLPGQSQSEVGSDASDQLLANGEPTSLARTLSNALTKLGWTVDVGSPLEDGSIVLDASHPPDGCRTHVRFESNGGTGDPVRLLVYYGAACPFE